MKGFIDIDYIFVEVYFGQVQTGSLFFCKLTYT